MYDIDILIKIRSFVEEHLNGFKPSVGLILGSGLGGLAEKVIDPIIIDYSNIPDFPVSTVSGHAGRFIFGQLNGCPVAVMQGRFHHYEGYTLKQVVMPVRIMAMLGCNTLIVTNAAGGINLSFKPGDLMLIEDHINLMGDNPLIGPNIDKLGSRFPDMSCAYDRELRRLALECADKAGVKLQRGIYVALNGPSYETPAEIRMLRYLGADAVGMSTVPEVIAAVHAGMRVLGISCISNMAAGILDKPLSHKEVMDTADSVARIFERLMMSIIGELL